MNKDIVTTLYHNEIIGLIDLHFSRFISLLAKEKDPDVLMAAALASHAAGNKHVCLDLTSMDETKIKETSKTEEVIRYPEISEWRKKLLACRAIAEPGGEAPLILDEKNRLYLFRYWQYENILKNKIVHNIKNSLFNVDVKQLLDSLGRLFPTQNEGDGDRSKIAAITVCFRRFCVITGGPGTGKTTTVAKILALLLEQPTGSPLRITLAAPTGKSAIRLGESIREIKSRLNCSETIKDLICEEAKTIHRMLKPLKNSPNFHFGPQNPLPADVVVVDEASMVDVALMSKLIQAVPENARLILIGDKDQLASVEAGSILGDICGDSNKLRYTRNWQAILEEIDNDTVTQKCLQSYIPEKISDCIVKLNKSYRFEESRGIEVLSRAINQGNETASLQILNTDCHKGIERKDIVTSTDLIKNIETEIMTGYTDYLNAQTPLDALIRFNNFKILCAVKKGRFGVEGINRLTEYCLGKKEFIDPTEEFYMGRPILIMENDYQNGLFNGDIGLIWTELENAGREVYAYFQDGVGNVKRFHPYRLPAHETAFAMTVHKSQGSEFDTVLFLLPEPDVPILTRELLYTGITRARKKIKIWGSQQSFINGINRTIKRHSGLKDMLWTSINS